MKLRWLVVWVWMGCARAPSDAPEVAVAAEPTAALGMSPELLRVEPRERSALFQRCPPADDKADARFRILAKAADLCRPADSGGSACESFLRELEAAPLETIGCFYAESPTDPEAARVASDALGPVAPFHVALSVAADEARRRSQGGQADEASRLLARVVRTAILIARGDDMAGWIGLGDIAAWGKILDDWRAATSEAGQALVRDELAAAKGGWLDVEVGLSAMLLRDAERGRVAGGSDGLALAEAALVTLEAFKAGSDLATQRAQLEAQARAEPPEDLGFARPGDTLTPKQRRQLVASARLALLARLDALAAAHRRGLAGLERARAGYAPH